MSGHWGAPGTGCPGVPPLPSAALGGGSSPGIKEYQVLPVRGVQGLGEGEAEGSCLSCSCRPTF